MTALCRYHYDPLDRLASRTPLAEAMAQRFYSTGQLATELQGAEHRSFVRSGAQLLAQASQSDTVLLGADQQNSVLQADDTAIAYAPYGHREDEAELPGFTGEQPDPVTGHYLLGNGYRAYNPVLMRFNSPDNLSPFGGGGLNAYSYCLGDPINRVDPTGHMSWQAGLGIGLSVFGIVASVLSFGAATPLAIAGLTTGVASGAAGVAQAVTEETSPQGSSVLGWVSLGLGVASAGFGLAAGFQKVGGMIERPYRAGSSGRGAGAAGSLLSRLITYEENRLYYALNVELPGPLPNFWPTGHDLALNFETPKTLRGLAMQTVVKYQLPTTDLPRSLMNGITAVQKTLAPAITRIERYNRAILALENYSKYRVYAQVYRHPAALQAQLKAELDALRGNYNAGAHLDKLYRAHWYDFFGV